MQDSGATFDIDRQPVLPLTHMLGQKTIKIAPSEIGAKIKSFKIEETNNRALIQQPAIELPNLRSIGLDIAELETDDTVSQSSALAVACQPDLRAFQRLCWHLLLSVSKKISTVSTLVLLILLQSSTQASNFLDRAKIYLDLNSQEAAFIPASGRSYLEKSQASPFNRAISQAREVKMGSPFYSQAQGDIHRWSETILDIARGRASEGDYAGAIAAAELVPQDNSSTKLIAQEADDLLENWELRARKSRNNQNYLIEARTTIDPERASSYSQAIAIVKQITPGAKEYQEAQSLIRQWNQEIYSMVKQRLDRGDFKQAVEAAILFSQDSFYHQLAQDSINNKIKSLYRARIDR